MPSETRRPTRAPTSSPVEVVNPHPLMPRVQLSDAYRVPTLAALTGAWRRAVAPRIAVLRARFAVAVAGLVAGDGDPIGPTGDVPTGGNPTATSATGHGPAVATDVVGALVREGERVRLRTHVPANRPAFQRWYADDEIAKLLRHDQEPLSAIQSRGYFDTLILPLSARGLCYAIHEVDTDRLIGTTALTDLTRDRDSALFRIVIGEKETWGQGYGTEATRLVVEEAFDRHGLAQVRLEVFRHNARAMAAYRRVGFRVTGEHTEWVGRHRMELHVIEMALDRGAVDDATHAVAVDFVPETAG